ncbi:MAG: TRAP transporter small permease [Bacteroidetes bacterium]|nr:TRAP transporter small permease [Bacteroidota bacterium]
MSNLSKAFRFIEAVFPAAIFLIICTVMIVQVFLRSVFNYSISWNVEFTRYLLVWLTFVGASYVRRENAHISLELVSQKIEKALPGWGRVLFVGIKEIIAITFLIFLIILGIQLGIKSWNFRSSAMQIRQFWLYIAVSVGSVGYLVREVQYLLSVIIDVCKKRNAKCSL